jgi:ankyrin repeat protein
MKRAPKILLLVALCLTSAFAGAVVAAVTVFDWHFNPQEDLHRACIAGQVSRVRLALALGAQVNGSGGTSPLSLAAMFDHSHVIEHLLSRGARIELTGKWGETALHWAAAHGNERAVESLLAHGADSNRVSHDLGTPRWAADSNHQRLVGRLPQPSADR